MFLCVQVYTYYKSELFWILKFAVRPNKNKVRTSTLLGYLVCLLVSCFRYLGFKNTWHSRNMIIIAYSFCLIQPALANIIPWLHFQNRLVLVGMCFLPCALYNEMYKFLWSVCTIRYLCVVCLLSWSFVSNLWVLCIGSSGCLQMFGLLMCYTYVNFCSYPLYINEELSITKRFS